MSVWYDIPDTVPLVLSAMLIFVIVVGLTIWRSIWDDICAGFRK